MTSEKQTEANRKNALLSAGPVTDIGRKTSSMNACRHGLTGQVTSMTDEDRAAHDQFSKALIKDLAPDGAMEVQLAQRVATDSWRLNRISAIEDNIFALGQFENGGELCPDTPQLDAAQVFTQQSKQLLQLLSLYEQRLNRAVQKNLALLQSLQATRKAERAEAMRVASELLQLSEMNGLEYVPSKDGFVFSTAEIHAAIDLNQRRIRAGGANFRNFKPRTFDAKAA